MKKFFFAGIMALVAACAAEQQASAWINSKFGVGMNWNWASGGNTLAWGLFRDGQPGAPDVMHGCGAQAIYPRPTCCVAPGAPAPAPAPQVICPQGAGAPGAPGFSAPPGVPPYPANANTQSMRYPTYRPNYPAAPSSYPVNYYRGY